MGATIGFFIREEDLKIDVFEFKDYKKYTTRKIDSEFKDVRGVKLQLATHIGCQPSYVSQVLNGNPHFTLEQTYALSDFFGHNKLEANYFFLLVQYARSGTQGLQTFFLDQIKEQQTVKFNLKQRFVETEEVPQEAHHKYYSAWYYAAIHVILSIPEFSNLNKISERLHLPLKLVVEVVDFLEMNGLIKTVDGKFELTKNRIHLDRDSTFIQRHHVNWRSQSLQSAEKNNIDDLHYSNVVTLSKADYPKVKDIFIKAIEQARAIIKPSKEEDICALTIDVFKL